MKRMNKMGCGSQGGCGSCQGCPTAPERREVKIKSLHETQVQKLRSLFLQTAGQQLGYAEDYQLSALAIINGTKYQITFKNPDTGHEYTFFAQ